MKVCMLTTSFPLREGDSAGSFVLEQARHLAKMGVALRVVAPHNPGAPRYEVMHDIPVHRFRYVIPEELQTLCYRNGIPDNLKRGLWEKAQLPLLVLSFIIQALRHARPGVIVHAHWTLAGLAAIVAGKILGRPTVLTLHHGSTHGIRGIERLVIEHADFIICNSTFTLEHTLKATKPKHYRVISPGVDTHRFIPLARETALPLLDARIPRDRPMLFTLGRLVELKGHRHLIDALAMLNTEPRPHLVIGGDGPLRSQLEEHARSRGLARDVTFTGTLLHHVTRAYYSASRIYVQPSIIDSDGNTEGLGLAVMEAMSCGTPCIGSRVGGIPDIITDGTNGFLVNQADPSAIASGLATLLENETQRMQMGRQARQTVLDKFSWESKALDLIDVYGSILHLPGK